MCTLVTIAAMDKLAWMKSGQASRRDAHGWLNGATSESAPAAADVGVAKTTSPKGSRADSPEEFRSGARSFEEPCEECFTAYGGVLL